MNAMESIVGLYKSRCGLRFDKEAAESLGLEGRTFSNYIKGRRRLPDMAIAKMAERGKIDALQIIAAVNLTFEKTPEEEKTYWQERYKTLMMYLRKLKIGASPRYPNSPFQTGFFTPDRRNQRPRPSYR